MKTSELTGAALDWAVAKCEGDLLPSGGVMIQTWAHYSTNWAQGGPIIERERIEITPWGISGDWRARDFYEPSHGIPCAEQFGKTPLIAAMRCYVASKFGDEVTIPEKLK